MQPRHIAQENDSSTLMLQLHVFLKYTEAMGASRRTGQRRGPPCACPGELFVHPT